MINTAICGRMYYTDWGVLMKKLVFVLILTVALLQTGIISANSEHISDWAKDEVNEAISLGFIPEKLQNNYNENITREEFVTVAVEYMSYQFDMSVEEMADRCKSTDDYFSDIEGSEFADYIRLAKRLGIIKGDGDGTFRPRSQITREEAVVILADVFVRYSTGWKMGYYDFSQFNDLDKMSHWAWGSFRMVYWLGVMNGVSDSEFAPKELCTREQCYVVFMRLCTDGNVSRYYGHNIHFAL